MISRSPITHLFSWTFLLTFWIWTPMNNPFTSHEQRIWALQRDEPQEGGEALGLWRNTKEKRWRWDKQKPMGQRWFSRWFFLRVFKRVKTETMIQHVVIVVLEHGGWSSGSAWVPNGNLCFLTMRTSGPLIQDIFNERPVYRKMQMLGRCRCFHMESSHGL